MKVDGEFMRIDKELESLKSWYSSMEKKFVSSSGRNVNADDFIEIKKRCETLEKTVISH